MLIWSIFHRSFMTHHFATGAKRSERKPRYDLIPAEFLLRLAQRYGQGAVVYGENNWQKGLPLNDTFNHIIAHLENVKGFIQRLQRLPYDHEIHMQNYHHGIKTEALDDDLAAAAWGIAALMYFFQEGIYVDGNSVQSHNQGSPSVDSPRDPVGPCGTDADPRDSQLLCGSPSAPRGAGSSGSREAAGAPTPPHILNGY